MKRYLIGSFLLVSLLPDRIVADIPIDKLRGEAVSEIGSIVKGGFGGGTVENQYLSRLGVNITASDTVKGKLRLTVGVGGIFYQPLPIGGYWQKSLKFAPNITEASSELLFAPNLSLEQGYFPFKYNSPAMDLGEYLLKSESYPGYISTGGWTWVDSAYTRAFGMRLKVSHFGGKFQHEAGIYMELNNAPYYDITPAYLFSVRPSKGVEFGGGIALRRWFTPNSGNTITNPKDEAAAAAQYVTIANFPEVQNQETIRYTYTDTAGKLIESSIFAAWGPGTNRPDAAALAAAAAAQQANAASQPNATVNNVNVIQDGSPAGSRVGIKKFLQNLAGCNADASKCTTYLSDTGTVSPVDTTGAATGTASAALITHTKTITRKAINLMAHASLDFTQIFGWEKRHGSLELYGEWAVLGVQNQPVYYQNILQRMPVMVGVHIPTFGLLDLLALETEYFDNPYPDSYQQLAGQREEQLTGVDEAIPDMDYTLRKFKLPSVHRDDWKWCVYGVKTILPGVKLKLQMANDHARTQYFDVDALAGTAFGAISSQPQTTSMSQWYYVAHLQWGF